MEYVIQNLERSVKMDVCDDRLPLHLNFVKTGSVFGHNVAELGLFLLEWCQDYVPKVSQSEDHLR